MTRRDYVLIAAAIRQLIAETPSLSHSEYVNGIRDAAKELANALKKENPRFDRYRFLAACGL